MCWAANSGEPSIPCQLQSSAWCRSPPRREKSFSVPTDHLLLSESQEETILPIISAYGSTHAVSVQSVLLTSPRQMKSYVFHLPLSEIKSWSFCFVLTLPKEKKFSIFYPFYFCFLELSGSLYSCVLNGYSRLTACVLL